MDIIQRLSSKGEENKNKNKKFYTNREENRKTNRQAPTRCICAWKLSVFDLISLRNKEKTGRWEIEICLWLVLL